LRIFVLKLNYMQPIRSTATITLNKKSLQSADLTLAELGLLILMESHDLVKVGHLPKYYTVAQVDRDPDEVLPVLESLAAKNVITLYEEVDGVPPAKKEKVVKRFVKPTLNEVQDYFRELQVPEPSALAEKFLAYYESNGWKVGKSPMKDWRAACRTWKSNIKADVKTLIAPVGKIWVYARGQNKPTLIDKALYDRSIEAGTGYYRKAS
jgi:hypothetical protein